MLVRVGCKEGIKREWMEDRREMTHPQSVWVFDALEDGGAFLVRGRRVRVGYQGWNGWRYAR